MLYYFFNKSESKYMEYYVPFIKKSYGWCLGVGNILYIILTLIHYLITAYFEDK